MASFLIGEVKVGMRTSNARIMTYYKNAISSMLIHKTWLNASDNITLEL